MFKLDGCRQSTGKLDRGYAFGEQGAAIMMGQTLRTIDAGLSDGLVVPYLGPGVLTLAGEDCPLPNSPTALTAKLSERYGDRKILTKAIGEAFRTHVPPTALHNFLATLPTLPLIVHDWYDDLAQQALAARSSWSDWGMVQGVTRAKRFGPRVRYLQADGTAVQTIAPQVTEAWTTLLYEPLGSVAPALGIFESDDDFGEPIAETSGQTPIPQPVQDLRAGRHFLFLGCRFTNESDQMFARQVLSRSSATHWAVLPETPTRNEAQFLAEQNIERIDLSLSDFVSALAETRREEKVQLLLASW